MWQLRLVVGAALGMWGGVRSLASAFAAAACVLQPPLLHSSLVSLSPPAECAQALAVAPRHWLCGPDLPDH